MRFPTLSVCLLLAAACSDPGTSGQPDAGTSPPSSVHIIASAGGTVVSPDGVFTLNIPPNAIASDTDFSIRIVPESEWPDEVRANAPSGAVYDIQPDGVIFSTPAQGIHHFATLPDGIRESDGSYHFVEHLMRTAAGVIEHAKTM